MDFDECHKSHRHCLMCGTANRDSLGLKFEPIAEKAVSARFSGSENLQGYSGYLHGGIISALLDCSMVHCLFYQGIIAVTTDLKVKFKKRIRCDDALEITGELKFSKYGLHKLCSFITQDGVVLAEAEARFFKADDL